MAKLNKNLINKIMLYVSHPCADIIRSCEREDFYGLILILKTKTKYIHKFNHFTESCFKIKNDTSKDLEDSYEYDVISRHIYNKLKVCMISEADVLRLCPEYVHVNKKIINYIVNGDEERIRIHAEETKEVDSDYSEDEHDYLRARNSYDTDF